MNEKPHHLSRREALQRIIAAAATISALDAASFGQSGLATLGTDPKLHEKIVPWSRVLSERELKTTAALCDMIIPADDKSPSASAVGVPDFINEWVSAPYPQQQGDRKTVQEGLAWLDTESQSRFDKPFIALSDEQKTAICDDICSSAKAKPEHKNGASFFAKMRDLTAGGFYTTPEGWKDLGYVGNVAMAEFPGPPPEVLKHLGLAAAS